MNSPSPYVSMNMEKNDFNIPTLTNGKETVKLYQNNENFYVHQTKEKFEPKYGYDEKNYYSNVGNLPAPQVPVEDRNDRATNSAVYSNVESPAPISVPVPKKTEKDIIYSNIQWNPKSENTYSNLPSTHTSGKINNMYLVFNEKYTIV